MNPPNTTPGEIITFYSYKGGTGRSMSLVNLAYLLADSLPYGKNILLLDWDLEAPGLHRYFHDRLRILHTSKDGDVEAAPGLIDLFCQMKTNAANRPDTTDNSTAAEPDEHAEWTPLDTIDLNDYILGTDHPNLHLIKAGRIDAAYSSRVNTFDWEDFYNQFPAIFRHFAEKLKAHYRYVFIDSRTGQTDTAGICTALMPEKLVTVFTPNRQSLLGIEPIIRQAIEYRQASEDMRPLMVFPLPSRVEVSQDELRVSWRTGDETRHIEGYEPFFVRLLSDVYGLTYCHLKKYFDEVQIRQSPVYAFGEEIAVLIEKNRKVEDDYSLTRAYRNLLEWLEPGYLPWQHPAVIRILQALEAKTAEEPIEIRSLTETITEGNTLVTQLRQDGNDGNARLLVRQLTLLAAKHLGPDHLATLSAMSHQADLHMDRGEFSEARQICQQVFERSKGRFGDEHPETISAMVRLAEASAAEGDLEQARTLEQSILEIRRKLLGERHPDTLAAMNHLAKTLQALGQTTEAQQLMTQILPLQQEVLGPKHPATMNTAATLSTDRDNIAAIKNWVLKMPVK